jgi:hypothetical protein
MGDALDGKTQLFIRAVPWPSLVLGRRHRIPRRQSDPYQHFREKELIEVQRIVGATSDSTVIPTTSSMVPQRVRGGIWYRGR